MNEGYCSKIILAEELNIPLPSYRLRSGRYPRPTSDFKCKRKGKVLSKIRVRSVAAVTVNYRKLSSLMPVILLPHHTASQSMGFRPAAVSSPRIGSGVGELGARRAQGGHGAREGGGRLRRGIEPQFRRRVGRAGRAKLCRAHLMHSLARRG